MIKVDSEIVVRLHRKKNKTENSPGAQDIPKVLALAFSVSILHLLCMPYNPEAPHESRPAAQTSYSGAISSSFYSAGYLSTKVPTNVYLAVGKEASVAVEDFAECGCYDFNQGSSCDLNQSSEVASTDSGWGGVGLNGAGSAGGEGCVGGEGGGSCVGGDDGGGSACGGRACVGGDGGGGGHGGECGAGGGYGGGGGCGGGGGDGYGGGGGGCGERGGGGGGE